LYKGKLLSAKGYQARYWNEYSQTMPREKLNELHLKRIKNVLRYAYETNKFYRELYDRHKVNIDDIKTLDDFKYKVPLTDKPMIQPSQTPDNLYGDNLSVDESFIAQHFATSGTTGKPLYEAWEDYVIWRVGHSWCPAYWSVGIRPEDTFYFAFDFGGFAGFWSAYFGALRFGAKVISGAGVGMTTEKRIQQILELKPTVLVATPTYTLHMANAAREMGVDPAKTSIKYYVGAGEPGSASVPMIRKKIEEAWGCKCAEVLGVSEPPVVAPTCEEGDGFHEEEMNQFAWVRDPDTGKEVKEGEVGERIITNFSNYATIWINYRTHDLVRPIYSCPCGCTWLYYKGGVLGRTDHMLTYKGTNIYQTAVENIVSSFPGASDYFQLVLTRENEEDLMTIKVEAKEDLPPEQYTTVAEKLKMELKAKIGVTLPVEVVPVQSLPRSAGGKTRRVIDLRPEDYRMELAKKYKSFE